ncbi:MAG TPA: TylF/MycF/NovP-related O-methyltransferase [Chitinophagaceae bacterium]|nr:TylF/MycF/NovP-related O-methyltransferase [Chitinophagaceae bacterium]
MLKLLNKVLHRAGLKVSRLQETIPPDISEKTLKVYNKVKPFTMTSVERISSLCDAVNYIISNKVEGDFVECGVWKGGSIMAMISVLQSLGNPDRKLWLYDTFEGMSSPTKADKNLQDEDAEQLLKENKKESSTVWAYSTFEEVKSNIDILGYPPANINYVIGKVEDTLVHTAPSQISLLRLDTDWYESTKIEMEILFPKLVPGGVLIIDDYGYWQGARKAIDEYIHANKIKILLNRIDYTGRIAIKI